MQASIYRITIICSLFYLLVFSGCTPPGSTESTPVVDSTTFRFNPIDSVRSVLTWITLTPLPRHDGSIPVKKGQIVFKEDTLRSISIDFDWANLELSENTPDSVGVKTLMDSLLSPFGPDTLTTREASLRFYDFAPIDSIRLQSLDSVYRNHFFASQSSHLATVSFSVKDRSEKQIVPVLIEVDDAVLRLKSFFIFGVPDDLPSGTKQNQNRVFLELGIFIRAPIE